MQNNFSFLKGMLLFSEKILQFYRKCVVWRWLPTSSLLDFH